VIPVVVTTAADRFKAVRVFSVIAAVPPVFTNTPDEYPKVLAVNAVDVSVPDVKLVDIAEAIHPPVAPIERLVSVTVIASRSRVTLAISSGEIIGVKIAVPGTEIAIPPE